MRVILIDPDEFSGQLCVRVKVGRNSFFFTVTCVSSSVLPLVLWFILSSVSPPHEPGPGAGFFLLKAADSRKQGHCSYQMLT